MVLFVGYVGLHSVTVHVCVCVWCVDSKTVTDTGHHACSMTVKLTSMVVLPAAQYQTAAVHVPSYVRELSAKLHRVKQQLQRKQHGAEPSLADIAAAAGVGIKQAEQALQATGGALQVRRNSE